jgi:hypothetical protein
MYRALLVVITLALSGCYSWTTIRQAPPGSETIMRVSGDRSAAVACIGDTRVGNDAEAFLITFREKLASAAVFADVRMTRCDDHTASVLNIVRAIHTDPHVTRMVLTSAAFVLYAIPTLIPYRYDYAVDLTVEVVRPNGAVRHYRSQADASEYHTIWAGFGEPRRAVRTAVTDRVVNDLVNQLARDRDFFAGD